jgi:hypothetical protein
MVFLQAEVWAGQKPLSPLQELPQAADRMEE